MSTQYVSILPKFQNIYLRLRKQLTLNRSKDFIQFLSECLVNLSRGELPVFQKEDVVKYRKKISEITQKRTPLQKRRTILSSTKGLQVHFRENNNWDKNKKKRRLYQQKYTIYSAVNARLKTSKNKHLIGSFLNSPRYKLTQSDNIILDNRDTKEAIVDFVCALKRKHTNFADVYFTILEATHIPPKLVIDKNASAKRNLDPFQNLKG